MRTNKVLNYESIIQVLGEPGCPVCRFMKNYQSALLQDPGEKEIHHLCSFHTWGLAATQRAAPAARLMSSLVEKPPDNTPVTTCDICVLLEMEEDRRIREFMGLLNHRLVAQWLKTRPALCIPHGTKLIKGLPQTAALAISSILERYRELLADELKHLHEDDEPDATRWGVLGHVAEFLVSQRGLRR